MFISKKKGTWKRSLRGTINTWGCKTEDYKIERTEEGAMQRQKNVKKEEEVGINKKGKVKRP